MSRPLFPVTCLLTIYAAALAGCDSEYKAPVAYGQDLTLSEDTFAIGSLQSSAKPADRPQYILQNAPAHGHVDVDAASGRFSYVPNPNFNGLDSFDFAVSDGQSTSEWSQVQLTVTAADDPPPAFRLGTVDNSAYTLVTDIQLPEQDVDGTPLTFRATSALNQVASVEVSGHTLKLIPRTPGTTRIFISSSDGTSITESQFDFRVTDVEKTVAVTPPTGTPAAVSLTNVSDRPATFALTYNGHQPFATAKAAAEFVAAMDPEYPEEGFPRKLWRYIRDNTYHNVPLSADNMWYDMWSTLNSLGWGFCGHVAAVYAEIARAAGYDARVWGLSGHVVPEILVNGRWEMYDPDMAVYYHNREGRVAGVAELSRDPSLITNPLNPVLPHFAAPHPYIVTQPEPYFSSLAEYYSSSENNYIDTDNFRSVEPQGNTQVFLPAGSRLLLPGRWTENPIGFDAESPIEVPLFRQAALELPAGFTGTLTMPWVLWDIQGSGVIRVGDRAYSTDDPSLRELLRKPQSRIQTLQVESNSGGVRLVFLINATWYDLQPLNTLSIRGTDVWAVDISTRPIAEENSTTPFPNLFRRPKALPYP